MVTKSGGLFWRVAIYSGPMEYVANSGGTATIFGGIYNYIFFNNSVAGRHWEFSHCHVVARHWPMSPLCIVTLPRHLSSMSACHVVYGCHVNMPHIVRKPHGMFSLVHMSTQKVQK
jgi:hypothetical protein